MEPSYMQIRAMASNFDGGNDYRKEKAAATFDPAHMPGPGRRVMPPGHRRPGRSAGSDGGARPLREIPANADWAGVVPPESKRKIVKEAAAARASLGPGLAPVAPEARAPARKHFEKDVRFASVEVSATGAPIASAAYQMGPGGMDMHGADSWKTETRAAMDYDTGSGRRRKGRKKMFGAAPGEAATPGSDRAAREAVEAARLRERREGAAAAGAGGAGAGGYGSGYSSRRSSSGSVGRAPTGRYGPNSLLSGIGAKIAKAPSLRDAPRPDRGAPAPRASHAISGYQGHRPSGVGIAGAGARRRSGPGAEEAVRSQHLLHGNYKGGAVPGYTGHFPRDPEKTRFA